MTNQTILVSTLGGQPQIVTFTLDLLLERKEQIDQVVVVYLASNPRYFQAYKKLQSEFVSDHYKGKLCHLRGIPIRTSDVDVVDITTSTSIEIVHQVFYQLLRELKKQSNRIHLSLTGGRRMMALVALEAAVQYLSPTDNIWHLYTSPELTEQARDGAVMHDSSKNNTQLLPVPFVPWTAYFPGLKPLLELSPQESRESAAGWLSENERERCKQVWITLTPRQQETLCAFSEGMTRSQVASHLGIAISTVDAHRNAIIQQCQIVWSDSEPRDINMRSIQQRFNLFLKGLNLV